MTTTALSEVLVPRESTEWIADPAAETFVTVRLRGGGAVKRAIAAGKTPQPFRGQRITAGDLIYSRIDARNGAFALIGDELSGAVVSKDFPTFALRADRILPSYLAHVVRAPQFSSRFQAMSFGATNRQRIDEGLLLAQRIPLPTLPEQRRIAAILDEADALRAIDRQQKTVLGQLAGSLFEAEFGGSQTHGFAQVTIGQVAHRVTDGTHQSPRWSESGIPFLFVSNLATGEIDFQTSKYVSAETYATLTKNTPIERGDVLYTAVGSYGTPAVVRSDQPFVFQRHIAHIKPRPNVIDSDYLAAAMAAPRFKAQADRVARGVAQKTVTLGELAKLVVPLPPLRQQKEFVGLLASRSAVAKRTTTRHAHLNLLFASLQHRAFRGEL